MNAKVAICECLLAINAEVDPVTREKWGPIIPPTAIDWIGNLLVSALASAGLLVTDADRAVLDAAEVNERDHQRHSNGAGRCTLPLPVLDLCLRSCSTGKGPDVRRLLSVLSTRRCRGCDDLSPHSHHLTMLGRWRYTRRLRARREAQ